MLVFQFIQLLTDKCRAMTGLQGKEIRFIIMQSDQTWHEYKPTGKMSVMDNRVLVHIETRL